MLCTLSPSVAHVQESVSVLHFAAAAKRVVQQPKVNEVSGEGGLLRQMQQEIAILRAQLVCLLLLLHPPSCVVLIGC